MHLATITGEGQDRLMGRMPHIIPGKKLTFCSMREISGRHVKEGKRWFFCFEKPPLDAHMCVASHPRIITLIH